MKTYNPKKEEIERKWWLVDADGKVLGRMATEIAVLLRGKNKPGFAAHVDTGDFVVVINAEKVRVTGNKLQPLPLSRWFEGTDPEGSADQEA
jgi:large subunit ribosomal protein L13